jgi:hypothetical protein
MHSGVRGFAAECAKTLLKPHGPCFGRTDGTTNSPTQRHAAAHTLRTVAVERLQAQHPSHEG